MNDNANQVYVLQSGLPPPLEGDFARPVLDQPLQELLLLAAGGQVQVRELRLQFLYLQPGEFRQLQRALLDQGDVLDVPLLSRLLLQSPSDL